MSSFDLHLKILPSFHRPCSIRIKGDVTGIATFEVQPTGLLPRIVLTLPMEAGRAESLHGCYLRMLEEWDEKWSKPGLDGIIVEGTFNAPGSVPRAFLLWSPNKSSAAHAMLSTALDCFPVEHCSGDAEKLLEIMRSYFGLQPLITMTNDLPPRLRIAPWVHFKDANEIEKTLRLLPEDGDLIVDASGIERCPGILTRILPMAHFRKRNGAIRWLTRSEDADALIAYGIERSTIEIVQRYPLSPNGYPIVLGRIIVSSPELISAATDGKRIELIQAFRNTYQLTIEQASRAATEMLEIFSEKGQ